MNAPSEKISVRTSYNLTAFSLTPKYAIFAFPYFNNNSDSNNNNIILLGQWLKNLKQ